MSSSRSAAYLVGYQRLPANELLVWQEVRLIPSATALLSRPEPRVICEACQEEIFNEREVVNGSHLLCWSCAGASYYAPLPIAEEITYLAK